MQAFDAEHADNEVVDHDSIDYKLMGSLGTNVRTPINVLWTIQTCNLVGTMLVLGYVVIYLKFVLIPLIMAYFMTFLMAFIIDPMELRPYPKPCGAIYLADAEGEVIKESLCRGF